MEAFWTKGAVILSDSYLGANPIATLVTIVVVYASFRLIRRFATWQRIPSNVWVPLQPGDIRSSGVSGLSSISSMSREGT